MVNESCCAVIKLSKAGNSVKDIIKSLCLPRSTVYKSIKRYQEIRNMSGRPGRGRKKMVNTPNLRNIIKCRIYRNPQIKLRYLARNVKINRETVRKIVKDDLLSKPKNLDGISIEMVFKRYHKDGKQSSKTM